MAKNIPTAIVITGASKEHAPLFSQFAYSSFPEVREVQLIQYPLAEVAFISKPEPSASYLTEQHWHIMRDLVETRIKQAFISGSRDCAIIASVQHNISDKHFDTCTGLLRHERDQLLSWAPFSSIAYALFTRNGTLIPFDLEKG